MKLSVLIPAHNEEACVPHTIQDLYAQLEAHHIEHEIIVINDNSTDRTEQRVRELQTQIQSLRLLNNPPPNGFGSAVRTGLDHFTGGAVAIFMADGSDSSSDLIKFFLRLCDDRVDCVFGSRFIKGSKVIGYPWLKLFLNRLGNWLIQILFGLSYNDVTNAFKMYRRHTIAGLQPLLSHHFNLCVELPLKTICRGYHYVVVPNTWVNRKTGVSKLQIKEMGPRYLFIILYCFLEKWLSKDDYHRKTLPFRKPDKESVSRVFTPL